MSEYNGELVEKVMKGMLKFQKFHHPRITCDISRMESNTIFCLIKKEKMKNQTVNVSELAKELNVSMQSISRTLKSLENKGYIIREVDADNRRNTLIKLSEKGNNLVDEKKRIIEDYFFRVFSHFTDEELQQYLNFQEKFYAAILEEGINFKEKEN